MKVMRNIFLVSLFIYSFLAGPLYGAQRAIRVVAKTPEGKEIPLYRGSYAFVVGNVHYTGGWDPLTGVAQDIRDVATVLRKHGFEVTSRTDLTRDMFAREIEDFCHRYGKDEDNRLFFYFAGHGHTEKMATGEDLGYLVMVDAPAPEKDPVGFTLCSVDMQSIVTRAKMIQARHVLFMFDSCFSGSVLNLRERVVPQTISESMRLPVRQFITAGRANEPVPDYSIFKQAFLDLLEGRDREPIPDGYLTGEELGLYLKNKVPQYNPAQHPQYGKINDVRLDKGDFVFPLRNSPKGSPPSEWITVVNDDDVTHDYQSERKLWDRWQSDMEREFARTDAYDKSWELRPGEKADAWTRFLSTYGSDNPYSGRDNELREVAETRCTHWESHKIETPVPLSAGIGSPSLQTGRDGRYVVYGNGIVMDAQTGLQWVAGPDRDMTWDEANVWVSGLDTNGGGWRLPTIAELKGLFRQDTGTRNMTPLLKTTGWSVWSGEAKGAAFRWALRLHYGSVICYNRSYAFEGRVFAVRSTAQK
jgi:hypothetical protein